MLAQKRTVDLRGALLASPVRRVVIAIAVLFAAPVFGVLTAFGVASDTRLETIPRIETTLPLALPDPEPEIDASATFRASDRVQRGDTVAALLQRLGVTEAAAFQAIRADRAARSLFTQLRPGKAIEAVTGAGGELLELAYFHSADQHLHIVRRDGRFEAREVPTEIQVLPAYKSGEIRSSLFGATDAAGIPDAIANQMARIFSTDIDFHIDLRKGDRFSVTYEMLHHAGQFLRPGRVLSAEFTNNGKTHQAYLFTDEDGVDGYYSADGQNRAKSFLRSALAFSRVSSGFGGRMHPIMKNWRQHAGVDFAAPKGTPVWATSDGTIEFAGVKGGYGNVIEVRHSGGITTLYAHLSGFASGVRRGTRVAQGQTIGYVGATGWATGPHLHYEFKVSGIHQDPMRVALPKAEPLAAKHLAAFTVAARVRGEQLALLRGSASARFE